MRHRVERFLKSKDDGQERGDGSLFRGRPVTVDPAQTQATATWVSPGRVLHSYPESRAAEPGEGQMGNVGLERAAGLTSAVHSMRWIPIAAGVLLVAFGLACFNYTKPSTLQHHQEWARANAMLAPSNTVFWSGVSSVAFGAFVLGFSVRRRHTGRSH